MGCFVVSRCFQCKEGFGICTINYPEETTKWWWRIILRKIKLYHNHAAEHEVHTFDLHSGLILMHTQGIHKCLHTVCVSAHTWVTGLEKCDYECDAGAHSVFLSAAGQTVREWGSQEVSRQKNSPGQGAYSLSTPKALEDMYYSHRKTRGTPKYEGWREERERGRDGSGQRDVGGQGRVRHR